MKVRLATSWEGHEADDVVDVDPSTANGLVNGGWAVPVDDESDEGESKTGRKRST